MFDIIADTIEVVHDTSRPDYVQAKKNVQELCRQAELAATAVLITSIGLAAIGVVAGTFGMPIIFVAVPLCFFSYNSSKIFSNLSYMIENPTRYLNLFDEEYNAPKIKKKLVEGTWCFDWAVDYSVDYLLSQRRRQKVIG